MSGLKAMLMPYLSVAQAPSPDNTNKHEQCHISALENKRTIQEFAIVSTAFLGLQIRLIGIEIHLGAGTDAHPPPPG